MALTNALRVTLTLAVFGCLASTALGCAVAADDPTTSSAALSGKGGDDEGDWDDDGSSEKGGVSKGGGGGGGGGGGSGRSGSNTQGLPELQYSDTGEAVNVFMEFLQRQLQAHLRDRSHSVRLRWPAAARPSERDPRGVYYYGPFVVQIVQNGREVASCRNTTIMQFGGAQPSYQRDTELDTTVWCGNITTTAVNDVFKAYFADSVDVGNYFNAPFQDYGH